MAGLSTMQAFAQHDEYADISVCNQYEHGNGDADFCKKVFQHTHQFIDKVFSSSPKEFYWSEGFAKAAKALQMGRQQDIRAYFRIENLTVGKIAKQSGKKCGDRTYCGIKIRNFFSISPLENLIRQEELRLAAEYPKADFPKANQQGIARITFIRTYRSYAPLAEANQSEIQWAAAYLLKLATSDAAK